MRGTSRTVGVREEERIQGTGGQQGGLIDVRGMTKVPHDLYLLRMHVAATCGSGQVTVRKTSSPPREADAGALGGGGSGIGAAQQQQPSNMYTPTTGTGMEGVGCASCCCWQRAEGVTSTVQGAARQATAVSRASFLQRGGATGKPPGKGILQRRIKCEWGELVRQLLGSLRQYMGV